MTQMMSLRIDTPVGSSSRLQTICYVSLAGLLILLAWLAKLSLSQYMLLLIVSMIVMAYVVLSRPNLLHLSQPPLSKSARQGWQLLMQTHKKHSSEELWQADLYKVKSYPWVIVFEFKIKEPYQRSLSTTIFRDQVSNEGWRKLNILASMITNGD